VQEQAAALRHERAQHARSEAVIAHRDATIGQLKEHINLLLSRRYGAAAETVGEARRKFIEVLKGLGLKHPLIYWLSDNAEGATEYSLRHEHFCESFKQWSQLLFRPVAAGHVARALRLDSPIGPSQSACP
jgi:hypothetical protein